ncbi:BURP domain protein [Actinidia chinensis var. chinensis]|uniref:BURP domain protein n=1 Tax=Actinidia chinensis var. chinensis TaxID=1590841 RepID=A0A2R6RBX0_ACTCC|nr:BURP domain protein [Actinidia chinensis var. chinensis]
MGSWFAHCSFLLYFLLVSRGTHSHSWKDFVSEVHNLHQTPMDDPVQIFSKQAHYDGHKGKNGNRMDDHNVHDGSSSPMDPALHVFFTVDELKLGKTIPIYFSTKDLSNSPHLLSREETDSIPFSLSQFQEILEFFSFPKHSPQAKAMEYTLSQCEMEPLKGETKFCATSLEAMLDSTRGIFGLATKFQVLTTKHLSNHTVLLQNYTILGVPRVVATKKMLACHTMPYPYAVYYCHGQDGDHKLYELVLGGDNGERVEAVGVCHVDTSQWDPDHVAFRVLKTSPGKSPVCHFFPAENLIWVASPTITNLVA